MSGPGQAAGNFGRGSVSLGARFVLLAVVALILMIVDHREDHLSRVREWLSLAVYPIHVVVDLPYSAWRSVTRAVADRSDLAAENARLRRQLTVNEYRLQNLNALKMENDRLRELLDTSNELTEDRVMIAEILSVDLAYRQLFVINRGSADDVYVGQPLLDADGVVGQIVAVSARTSEAMLITDVNHSLHVAVERTGARTFAEGTGDSGLLRLPYLTNSATANLQRGDLLITSGLGGIYPSGRPVAVIDEIIRRPGQNFAEVTARPVSSLDRDQEVLLVWNDSLLSGSDTGSSVEATVATGAFQ